VSVLGKAVTHRDRDVPMARSTWLGRAGNGRSCSQPSCLPPCPPGARWSTGVIMYTLLAGSPPFWHRKQMLMLRMIMSGNYQFGSPEWDDYSDTVKDLVSRFLVVNPQGRYSAEEALAHPFFQQYVVEEVRHFSPRGKFKVIALTVLASVRIYYQYRRVKPVSREIIIRDPYALRPLRRLIDAYAFRIYGHWVKKGQQQNRAALFENTPKAVLLSLAEEDY